VCFVFPWWVQQTGLNGQGGIRTLDTLTGIPVFEANTANAVCFAQSGIVSKSYPDPSVGEGK
jgi:hypothetical protein